MHNNRFRACLSVRHTFALSSFVVELLRDGLEFPNAILQDGYRYVEDGLCKFS